MTRFKRHTTFDECQVKFPGWGAREGNSNSEITLSKTILLLQDSYSRVWMQYELQLQYQVHG